MALHALPMRPHGRGGSALRADDARVERARRRLEALGPRLGFSEWLKDHPETTCPGNSYSDEEVDALYEAALSPWTRVEEAVRAAEGEAWVGMERQFEAEARVRAAEHEVSAAVWAAEQEAREAHFAVEMAEAAAADEAWEALVAENERLRRELREARGQAVEVREVSTQASGTWPTLRAAAREGAARARS